MRSARSMTVALASIAALALVPALGASAAPPAEIGPSSFFDIFPEIIFETPEKKGVIEWTARTSTTVDVPGAGLLTVDVWEHAYFAYTEDDNVDGDLDDRGEGRLTRGRCQIVIDFTSAGVSVPFEGTVHGAIDGLRDDANLACVMRASSPGGARLELRHSGKLDLVSGMFDGLELDGGALERR